MTKIDPKKLYEQLQAVAKSRTATADTQFDDEGNPIKPTPTAGRLEGDENVVVIESNQADAAVAVEDDDEAQAGKKGKGLFASDEEDEAEAA
jgi:hypothetical protein